ncbi:outer membrane lipoprotein carrier protein LolA [Alkaliphilus pronyensis]|uniref:Outer membrane lipoprotein carrier protein LolA n=1 Tax=Alkaliphilus pronyensis TaxID=1482732 RepID=A0A6I0EY09_9FIRM|nr:outer-membrane lipoprotein carrier protein LolA [Alkaliphilus pronyensis]KAB3534161.1 outer membrane lipoprotein carrier protein LolA [Alkaliphilus pronyensis]
MRLIKVAIIGVLCFLCLTACKQPTNEEIYYKAQKKINAMESYSCIARIIAKGETGSREYVMEQIFKYPNKYRLEIIMPEELKGNATIYNGKMAWVIDPSINEIWRMNSFEGSKEQLLFIGYFMENVFSNGSSTILSKNEEKQLLTIETELPKNNYYFHSQKLWIDTRTLKPVELQILDEDKVIKFSVAFENFQYNPKLDDKLFYIHSEVQ